MSSTKWDCMMAHDIGASTLNNAKVLSHHSIQGHHHGCFSLERWGDKNTLRWSMTVGCLIDERRPAFRYGSGQYKKRPILGIGMLIGSRGNTLIISDLHIPYQHPQAFDFLYELNHIYKFDRILNVGDLYDNHSGSFHTSEPDALNAEDEFNEAKRQAKILQEIFPSMDITKGNHCKIPQRKAKEAGLPTSMLGDFNSLYGTRSAWKWHDNEFYFDTRGAYPFLHPMVLNSKGEWDGDIMVPVV